MHKLLSSTLILIHMLFPVMTFGQAIDLTKAVSELTDKLVSASKGEVVGVEGDIIYINLGQKEGVLEGNKFEVVRLGEPLRGGMGYRETLVGEAEVMRVREKASIAKVTQKSSEIKEGDQVYQLRKKISRMAVTEFLFGDKFNDLTLEAQNILYTNFIQKGMSVVEREKLDAVLREQKTAFSGTIDLSTAAQVGKMLGVEAVLVGSVSDLGNALALIARLVDVEKGVALTAARVEVAKTPMLVDLLTKGVRLAQLLERGRVGTETSSLSSPTSPQSSSSSTSAGKSRDNKSKKILKTIKESADALAKRAGHVRTSYGTAMGLVAEYNQLIQEAKVSFKDEPSIQSLKELQYPSGIPRYDDSRVQYVAQMVAAAAQKLTLLIEAVE